MFAHFSRAFGAQDFMASALPEGVREGAHPPYMKYVLIVHVREAKSSEVCTYSGFTKKLKLWISN